MAKPIKKISGSQLGRLVRLVALAVAVVLIVFNIGNILLYNQIEPLISERMGSSQAFSAKAASQALRPSWIRSYSAHSSGAYGKMLTSLIDEFRENGNFVSVTLLDTSGTVVYSSGGGYHPGEYFHYLAIDKSAFNSAMAGIPDFTELYEGSGIYLRGAYAPVYDELGEVEWIIGTEAGAEYYAILGTMKRNLLLFIFLSLVVAIVAGAILLSAAVELNRMEKRLVQASTLSSIGEMASGVAHEVRNPLAIISGSTERLRKSEKPEERTQLLNFIEEEVNRIDDILTGYLSFARPAVGDARKILLGELACDIANRIIKRAQESDVQIEIEIEKDGEVVIAESAIRRALLNLYLNAIEAMPGGGKLKIRSSRSLGRIRLEIADNGIGMSKNTLDRIFEPFVTSKSSGTGLGLTLVKNIIENAGGEISVSSKRGVGTSFFIDLPVVD